MGMTSRTCRCCVDGSPTCSRPRWPRPARCWWTPPWAGPATPARCCGLPGPPADRSRRRPGRDRRGPASSSHPTPTGPGWSAPCMTGSPNPRRWHQGRPRARRGHGPAVRPRRLLAAARRPGPRLRLRPGHPARHADGPTAGRTAADIVNGYPAAELARMLRDYGEERFARRIADAVVRERAGPPITSTHGWRDRQGRDPGATRRPGATRPSAPSRRCGSRSTTSSAPSAGRCPPRWTCWPSAAASSCSPTTRSRTASSSGSSCGCPPTSAARPARARERGHAAVPPAHQGCRAPRREEVAGNPRAASARLRAAERIRQAA